jgi:hypothetical protein
VLEPCHAFNHARVVTLRQGLRLLLMTDDLFDEIQHDSAEAPVPGFWKLPIGFDQSLAAWSMQGPVAYVEADYFGGVGTQIAAVWDAGALVLGPLAEPETRTAPTRSTPISQALRRLGVSAHGHVDEFDAIGLGRHRDTDNWLDEVSSDDREAH